MVKRCRGEAAPDSDVAMASRSHFTLDGGIPGFTEPGTGSGRGDPSDWVLNTCRPGGYLYFEPSSLPPMQLVSKFDASSCFRYTLTMIEINELDNRICPNGDCYYLAKRPIC